MKLNLFDLRKIIRQEINCLIIGKHFGLNNKEVLEALSKTNWVDLNNKNKTNNFAGEVKKFKKKIKIFYKNNLNNISKNISECSISNLLYSLLYMINNKFGLHSEIQIFQNINEFISNLSDGGLFGNNLTPECILLTSWVYCCSGFDSEIVLNITRNLFSNETTSR